MPKSPENNNSVPIQEQGDQVIDKLEQYLQKIEEGKSDPIISEIVNIQGEYVDQRVDLKDEQGEEIKQLAIKFIEKLSELDLEVLVSNPHLIASMYEREVDEGLGDSDLTHGTGKRFQKCDNPYMPQEASAKLVFLAYATKILGDLQENFLQEYLGNDCSVNGSGHFSPKQENIKYIVHDEDGTVDEDEFMGANPAFVKFSEQYRQAWDRSQKLKKSSHEFKGLIVNSDNENSPVRDKASAIGAFYGTWSNGIMSYFRANIDGTMNIPSGRRHNAPFGYDRSFGTSPSYSFSVRNIDEQGVVHLDSKKVKEEEK